MAAGAGGAGLTGSVACWADADAQQNAVEATAKMNKPGFDLGNISLPRMRVLPTSVRWRRSPRIRLARVLLTESG